MKNPILQYTPQLEQDLIALHTGNNQAKQWFYQSPGQSGTGYCFPGSICNR